MPNCKEDWFLTSCMFYFLLMAYEVHQILCGQLHILVAPSTPPLNAQRPGGALPCNHDSLDVSKCQYYSGVVMPLTD